MKSVLLSIIRRNFTKQIYKEEKHTLKEKHNTI